MYEQFGAVIDQDKVEFKLFFPDNSVDPAQYTRGGLPKIKEIRVRGDFQSHIGGQDWELATAPMMAKNPHPKGWLYACKIDQALPEGFYQYKILLRSKTKRRAGAAIHVPNMAERMNTKTRALPSAATGWRSTRFRTGCRLGTWSFTS